MEPKLFSSPKPVLLVALMLATACASNGDGTSDPGDGGKADSSGAKALQRGVPVLVRGSAGDKRLFTIQVPEKAEDGPPRYFGARLDLYKHDSEGHMLGPIAGAENGNADLYIRRGQPPTEDNYDASSTSSNNDELATIDHPDQGTYYILVKGSDESDGKPFALELFADYAAGWETAGGTLDMRDGDGPDHFAYDENPTTRPTFRFHVKDGTQAELRSFMPFGDWSTEGTLWTTDSSGTYPSPYYPESETLEDGLTTVFKFPAGSYELAWSGSFWGGITRIHLP